MKTILVADDEPHLRLLVSKTLDSSDYEIVEAEDGTSALAMVRSSVPDLLILDWMMPEMSGIDVLRAVREDPATTTLPVIMLTARTQKPDRNEAVSLGIRGFLAKPFSPLDLIELVEKVLTPGNVV